MWGLRSLVLLPLFVGCSAAAAGTDTGPIELSSEHGAFRGVFRTEPAPASVGKNRILAELTLPEGPAVEHAELSLELWMPAHGHGSDIEPKISEQGGGSYTVDNIGFPMPGPWEVTIGVSADGNEDAFGFTLNVE